MKAIVYEGPEKLVYQDVSEVKPGTGEVKIRVKACGICGSDVHGYLGLTGRRLEPMIMGHEFAGVIVETGDGVRKAVPGDRVAVYPVDFCGECKMCREGNVHLCMNKKAYGVLDVDGAFAEYICVPEKCCFPLKEEISWAIGSLMEPLAVAYRGVSHAGELEGKNVLLIGTGTIGLLALACVKMKNPAKILVSDLSGSRLELAKKMGADVLINPGKEDFKKKSWKKQTGWGQMWLLRQLGQPPRCSRQCQHLPLAGRPSGLGTTNQW